MDNFEKIAKEAEREGIFVSQNLIKILMSMWENAGKDLRDATASAHRHRIISIVFTVLSCVCLFCCIYMGSVIHRQSGEIAAIRGEIESIHQILDAGVVVEETTTTTTTTVEQDTGEGSGNNVFQAGENSSYTQNGGAE